MHITRVLQKRSMKCVKMDGLFMRLRVVREIERDKEKKKGR